MPTNKGRNDEEIPADSDARSDRAMRRAKEQTKDLDEQIASLSDQERMLLQVRDELYEGSWEQFVIDLKARLAGEPYVFEIGSSSDKLKETIGSHLEMIDKLQAIEARLGIDLNTWLSSHE